MTRETRTIDSPIRIGAVSYLNSKPLVYGLDEALPDAEVVYDLPSRLADGLAAGTLDVALVPIVEYLRDDRSMLVSNACVACCGPVLSVKLYFRTPPAEVRRLALDEGSRTSAALAQVLLKQLHGNTPELCKLPIGNTAEQIAADAVLMIGDRAMHEPEGPFCEVWDLGEKWCQWAELPFVFAAWIARRDSPYDLAAIAAKLQEVRDAGAQKIGQIARAESAALGIDEPTAHDYLQNNLHFTLGTAEVTGMRRFAKLLGYEMPSVGQRGATGKPVASSLLG